ncbi:GNAT family N-acetyltransferase [Natronospirillum operosum]|uniref:GNAT family N-acetyltransferase n=1 Tax=Natronospirillum operosum TaxID=2759953 RepID=A0A4Z0WAW0_9GAMM|nr:GNAT family N-acetyltransferase [Natronospirillum operosum]TGG91686.1 GNAT family N-acetyltransferase [Natronospirillum operosum]
MEIRIDDLSDPRIAAFLDEHLTDMRATSPPESTHALDLDGLKKPDVTFWTAWVDSDLVGCGALKELTPTHAEIKSMRISSSLRGSGLASKLLTHILQEAEQRGYHKLSLETGSMEFFKPARRLYEKFGFQYCPPFADYREDPNSVFMELTITTAA